MELILLALCASAPVAVAAEEPRVTVTEGELEGALLDGGGALFAGIPYAAAPVGELRWKPPAEPARWSGLRAAKSPGPTCPQPKMGWNDWDAARTSEDCLNLNIWLPAGQARHRPVMVWFHGGAFLGGSGSAPIYDGAALSRNGVIVVSVNYRLGVLGFLAHPELSAENPGHVSGNYGLQDQIAALAWVHRNIGRFGGDPDNVTIFGQSAGSISVANLITIPEARKYFRRAILQSGTPFGIGDLPALDEAERSNAAFGNIEELRALPAQDVVARWSSFADQAPAVRRAWPVVDGRTLRQQPASAYLSGAARDVPLLVGSIVREIPPASHDDLLQWAQRILGGEAASVIAEYEARGSDPHMGDPGTQMMTDMLFRCGTIQTARVSGESWLYHFLENFPGRAEPAHSAEVFYVFGTASLRTGPAGPDPAQDRLAETMRAYWTNFAAKGDPNGTGIPAWPRYSARDGSYVELAASGVRTSRNLRQEACAVFLDHWSSPPGRAGD